MSLLTYLRPFFCSPTLEEQAASDLKEARFTLLSLHKQAESINAGIAAMEVRIARLDPDANTATKKTGRIRNSTPTVV